MLTIYTDKNKIPEGYTLERENDAFFDAYILCNVSEESFKIMQEIDNVQTIDKKAKSMTTNIGTTSIMNLSTGCKTFVNIIESKKEDKKIFSLNECGENVAIKILDYIREHKPWMPIYVTIPSEIFDYDTDEQVLLNGEAEVDFDDALDSMEVYDKDCVDTIEIDFDDTLDSMEVYDKDWVDTLEIDLVDISARLKLRDRKIVIDGDTATGKSLLVSAIERKRNVSRKDVLWSKVEIFGYRQSDNLAKIRELSNKIIVIDNANLLMSADDVDYINSDYKNQYIIIGRYLKGLTVLPNHIAQIVKEEQGDTIHITLKYKNSLLGWGSTE